ncbi:MAG: hypothetical protein ABIQ70_05250 [Dokdonella sp.]
MKSLTALAALAVFAGSAQAASVAWRVPVYADITTAPGIVERKPLLPAQNTLEYQVGGEGSFAGYVIGGAARMDPDASPWPGPLSPYVTKVAALDGHVVWRWQPDGDLAVEGRIRQVKVDQENGSVYAIGFREVAGVRTSLLVKLNGSTGIPVWRVDGPPGSSGHGVDVGPFGDIVATFYSANSQFVAMYALPTGAELWSQSIPDASDDWDDFKVSFPKSSFNVLIAGHYATPLPAAETGVQVAQFDSNGATGFSRRYPGPVNSSVGSLDQIYPSSDGLLNAGGVLKQLDLAGETLWSQQTGATLPWIAQVLNGTYPTGEALFIIGDVDTVDSRHLAEIDELSTVTGESQWHTQFSDGAPLSAAKALRLGFPDDRLLFAWTSEDVGTPRRMHATGLDYFTHEILWQVDFGSADAKNENNPIDIQLAPDNSVFVDALTNEASAISTATLYKLAGPFTQKIFASGFD